MSLNKCKSCKQYLTFNFFVIPHLNNLFLDYLQEHFHYSGDTCSRLFRTWNVNATFLLYISPWHGICSWSWFWLTCLWVYLRITSVNAIQINFLFVWRQNQTLSSSWSSNQRKIDISFELQYRRSCGVRMWLRIFDDRRRKTNMSLRFAMERWRGATMFG